MLYLIGPIIFFLSNHFYVKQELSNSSCINIALKLKSWWQKLSLKTFSTKILEIIRFLLIIFAINSDATLRINITRRFFIYVVPLIYSLFVIYSYPIFIFVLFGLFRFKNIYSIELRYQSIILHIMHYIIISNTIFIKFFLSTINYL